MSSAINHKARSRRGSVMKNGFLATKRSPMIQTHVKENRRAVRMFLANLFNRKGGE